MTKQLCEKAIFSVLLYRNHKHAIDYFGAHSATTLYKSKEDDSFKWIKRQSEYIDEKGIDNWINKSKGSTGIPLILIMKPLPFTYVINFRTNIFYK
jgi:hypothetical protein